VVSVSHAHRCDERRRDPCSFCIFFSGVKPYSLFQTDCYGLSHDNFTILYYLHYLLLLVVIPSFASYGSHASLDINSYHDNFFTPEFFPYRCSHTLWHDF